MTGNTVKDRNQYRYDTYGREREEEKWILK